MSLIFRNAQADNDQKVTIQFDQTVANGWAVLAGFEASYGSSDHHVEAITAHLNDSGGRVPAASLDVTAEVTIDDGDGHTGGGTLYIMAIGQTKDDGSQFKPVTWRPGDGQQTVTIDDQPAPLEYAWIFIKGFDLTYGRNNHHVQTIALDAGNTSMDISSVANPVGNGYTWTITFTPSLVMRDDSGHDQSGQSALELLVMAVPAGGASSQTRMHTPGMRGRGGAST